MGQNGKDPEKHCQFGPCRLRRMAGKVLCEQHMEALEFVQYALGRIFLQQPDTPPITVVQLLGGLLRILKQQRLDGGKMQAPKLSGPGGEPLIR